MRQVYCHALGLCGLVMFVAGANAQETASKWAPHVDVEGKAGTKRNIGEIDFFVPVHQDSNTLVFANVRTRADNQESFEGNFGLGLRQMQSSGWNLGAYGYFDRRHSPNQNYYNQYTLGLEALGRDVDLRANTYLPIGTRVREIPEISTASISGTSVQVDTNLREERALKGFDLEAGWRAPLFDSEAARQLRLYAGGYRFSDGVVTVQGPRLRAELSLEELPSLGAGARLYLGAETQHDSQRGTQSFLSLRIRIPLGKESSYGNHLSAQERRMTAPIVRDVDIVTQARTRATVVETATTTGGQTLTAIDSRNFSGTDLTSQLTAAGTGSTVILSGTFNTSAMSTMQTGQTLMAGTIQVRTPSGRVVPLTTSATINATDNVTTGAIRMATDSTVSGLTINSTNSGTNAIGVNAVSTLRTTIINNTITATAAGAGVTALFIAGTGVTVSGNTLTAISPVVASPNVIALYVSGATATVTGNSFYARNVNAGSNRTIYLQGGSTVPTINAGSTGNTLLLGGCFQNFGSHGSIGFSDGTSCP